MTCNRDDSYIHSATDERLLAAQDEINLLREQLEFSRELTESLKLESRYKDRQLQEVEQELKYTNHDLCTALMLEQVCFEEAKELAKTILKSKKPVSQSLAELLSAIYGSTVKIEEVEQIDRSSITIMPLKSAEANMTVTNSRNLKERSEKLSVQYKEIGFRFVGFQGRFLGFKARCAELIEESKSRTKNSKKNVETSNKRMKSSKEHLDNGKNHIDQLIQHLFYSHDTPK